MYNGNIIDKNTNTRRFFALFRPGLCALCIAGTGLGVGLASAEEQHASNLLLRNCGAYTIDKVIVQGKLDGTGWFNTGISIKKDIKSGKGVCVDIGRVAYLSGHSIADQYRLKVKILGGDWVTCDGTNYKRFDFLTRRAFKMRGTKQRNNACKSLGYNPHPSENIDCSRANGNAHKFLDVRC